MQTLGPLIESATTTLTCTALLYITSSTTTSYTNTILSNCISRSRNICLNSYNTALEPTLTMSGPPAQALATHLINQTLSSLSLLETLEIISRDDASRIRSMLPNAYGPFPSLNQPQSPSISNNYSQLSVGPTSSPPQVTPQPMIQPLPAHSQNALVPSIPPRAPMREIRARALWDYNGAVRLSFQQLRFELTPVGSGRSTIPRWRHHHRGRRG